MLIKDVYAIGLWRLNEKNHTEYNTWHTVSTQSMFIVNNFYVFSAKFLLIRLIISSNKKKKENKKIIYKGSVKDDDKTIKC